MIVVNFDSDISRLFTHIRLAGAILNLHYNIRATGLFLQVRVPMGLRNVFPNHQ